MVSKTSTLQEQVNHFLLFESVRRCREVWWTNKWPSNLHESFFCLFRIVAVAFYRNNFLTFNQMLDKFLKSCEFRFNINMCIFMKTNLWLSTHFVQVPCYQEKITRKKVRLFWVEASQSNFISRNHALRITNDLQRLVRCKFEQWKTNFRSSLLLNRWNKLHQSKLTTILSLRAGQDQWN